ncbi:MAG: RdgB/HAM1 family non-canonical purine NTP pyrophosphatase [Myxococcota bacterium]
MRLVVATNNAGKVREYERLLADLPGFTFESLASAGIDIEVVEDRDTFYGNALKKAQEVAAVANCAALSDDSGLVVDALGGRPGVYSARYSGQGATPESNNAKLLEELRDVPPGERTARFVCTIVLVDRAGKELAVAEGACEGTISDAPRGDHGFGYDPLFVPLGYDQTMAELSPEEKNRISHRGKATAILAERLRELQLS